ncbi:uncharacterized protein BXIN_1549 [Babesia sp. Xinjiang]|uniref:uncharacterized protein n=1 Tax=Babesia sp. Xinjiang TaxID=462227 RepID=UPI000A2453DD|nr:uncharacterized protein BXIN_1549 [Babesia sp. Xinjiang]ORM42300.1 hypothetical protein BXIN_1549 [Babesia sp. Xinjiang]
MKEYLSIAKNPDVPFTDEHVSQVVSFFDAIIAALSSISDSASGPLTRDKILEETLSLMESALERNPHKMLYMALGQYYWREGKLTDAQKHLVYTQDVEVIFKMLEDWASSVQEHEKPLVYLRCVLIQLAIGDFSGSKCLLLMLNQDFETGESVSTFHTRLTFIRFPFRCNSHTFCLRCARNRTISCIRWHARFTSPSSTQILTSRA